MGKNRKTGTWHNKKDTCSLTNEYIKIEEFSFNPFKKGTGYGNAN
jgi:hypothetical protein